MDRSYEKNEKVEGEQAEYRGGAMRKPTGSSSEPEVWYDVPEEVRALDAVIAEYEGRARATAHRAVPTERSTSSRSGKSASWNITLGDFESPDLAQTEAGTSKSKPGALNTMWEIKFDSNPKRSKPKLPERLAKKLLPKPAADLNETSMLGKGTYVIRRHAKGERPKLNGIFPLPIIGAPEPRAPANRAATYINLQRGQSKYAKGNADHANAPSPTEVTPMTRRQSMTSPIPFMPRNQSTLSPVSFMSRKQSAATKHPKC